MRRGRVAAGTGVALVSAAAGLAAAFLWGVAVPGEFLRARLERALTAAFGVPARIEGPLRLRTGLSPTASADALVLADPSGPAGATLARGLRPAVRIDLVRLLRGAVMLEEVTGERLEIDLVRAADGRANWTSVFATTPGGGPPPVTFAGIGRLRIGAVVGSYRGAGAAPLAFGISNFDGTLPLRDPATARGSAQLAGQTVAFDLRTAPLANLGAPGAATPVQGTLDWSGVRIAVDGAVAPDGSRFDGGVQANADDAGALLAALGVVAREPGRFDARGRFAVTAAQASVDDLALHLGDSAMTGRASVAWGGARPRIVAALAAKRVDVGPFLGAEPTTDKTVAETLAELLERAATGADAEVVLAIGELAGTPIALGELELEGRSADRVIAVRADGTIAGTRAKATLDYDARKPQRTLAARIDGGAVATARLPSGERPPAIAGATGGIRGQLRAAGGDPRALVASAQASLEARDLRWTLAGRDGRPLSGRFDAVRIALQGTRASSAEITGRLGAATCSLKVSGGALAPLLERAAWPVQLAGVCPGGRLTAQGRITLAERHVAADLAFDASAARIGPIAQAFGVAPTAPHPFAARGRLAVDEQLAHVRLDALRLGGTAGAGEIAFPLGAGAPRVRLALASMNVDELNALGEARPAPADPLDREVVRENLRLPDADFDIAAERVAVAGEILSKWHFAGAIRAGRLPPAAYRFAWRGAAVAGELGADFSGVAPRVQVDAKASNADLGGLLARFGWKGGGLRAGALTVRARSEGERLGELLAAATLDATLERARLDLAQRPAPGLAQRADFAATLKAAPGQPAAATARGTLGDEPFDVTLDLPSLAGLARAGEALPVSLRAALGDARLQGTGKVARDGTGEGRVALSGDRVDRLGKLVGVELPAVGPYAARGTVVVTADAIRASDLDVSFGKSRLMGKAELQIRRAGRAVHSTALRAPALHLEDIGAARWLGGPARPAEGEAPAAQRREAELARALDLLRAADVDASIEVDALHGGAERFASGRLRVSLAKGVLRARLEDVKTAGGTIDGEIGVDANSTQPKVAVRARVAGLEFGPLVRVLDPASKLGGRLDLDADLAAQGPPGQLLPALGGTIDVAVFPHDLSAGALAFWGTGLLSALLRSLDPNTRSEVECAAASLDVAAGVASTSAFFVDTTRVRIVGQVEANLLTRALSGRIRPVSEQPELFTVAPTMLIGGTIGDPRVSVAPENVVLAPLRFATPLAGFALDFVGAKGRLTEGRIGCREAYERARQLRAGARAQ